MAHITVPTKKTSVDWHHPASGRIGDNVLLEF